MQIDLEFVKISRKYSYQKVLNQVSGSLFSGDSVFLQGNNGAGKSTLLNILCGILRPDHGKVSFRCRPYLISHAHWFYSGLTLFENLKFQSPKSKSKNLNDSIHEALSLFKVSKAALLKPHQCSKGMLQRVSLARSFLWQSDILLLDEPFSGLDQDSQDQLSIFLQEKKIKEWHFSSFIIVDHDKQRGNELTNKKWELNLGKLQETL